MIRINITVTLQIENSSLSSKSCFENGVKALKQLLHSSADVALTGNILWRLSSLWFASKSSLDSQTTVPENLDYLGEDSVLNGLVHLLIQLGKPGPASDKTIEIINTILRVLTDGPKDPFPPLNWMNILTPLVKNYFGTETTKLCLDFALCSTSPTATGLFLVNWLSSSVVINLGRDSKVRLYLSLNQLVRILSTKKSKEILEITIRLFSEKELDTMLVGVFLTGLHSVLTMADPPKSIVSHVKEAVENIYRLLSNDLKSEHQVLVSKLVACLQHFSAGEVEQLTKPEKETFLKSLAIRKQLTIKDPTLSCNLVKPCVDLALSTNVEFDVLSSIVSTISCLNPKNLEGIIVEWVIQLLSSLGLPENSNEATNAIFVVLAVLSLSATEDDITTAILALTNPDTIITECFPARWDIYREWFSTIKSMLPIIFPRVVASPVWKLPIEKVIDKLLCLHQSLCSSTEASRVILEMLLELRCFDVYEKRSIWTQVVSCL